MGRPQLSQGLAPPAVRKDVRAKQARHLINKIIPSILASNARARGGADGSELIVYSISTQRSGEGDGERHVKRKEQERRKDEALERGGNGQHVSRSQHEGFIEEVQGNYKSKRTNKYKFSPKEASLRSEVSLVPSLPPTPMSQSPKSPPKIKIITTDTLTAARMMALPPNSSPRTSTGPQKASKSGITKKQANVLILNMASPLRPGGGVLSGATSQEEFLCARTTLLPSLKDTFYRLPEFGGVFTRDVLVVRNALPLGDAKGELPPGERYWVDVVSAGMLRFPELEGEQEENDENKSLTKADRAIVEAKMRAVLSIALSKGSRKVVLGAWGCGAYGNPVHEIAQAWRMVLNGVTPSSGKGKPEGPRNTWDSIEEVVFAITNHRMADRFAASFGGGIEVESGPGGHEMEGGDGVDEEDEAVEELKRKIMELQGQLESVWNPGLKARMISILDGLKAQLRDRAEGQEGSASGDEDEGDDGGGGDHVSSDGDHDSTDIKQGS
ncbi:hypothetical protein B0J11DRAFT_23785 [Dendryphion nanum]|uniref:Microbial-type PARG catalytic domain-containing protein n=1 Tax=Dendryphion nanum TaxID=256645 RepID=A0A9P9EFX0_9PLEO|nr:hypothetical protein B0J11DRAFT_23785 [Dendryphion nanum]